eukprot:TRINITY_DN4438_c1_g3_i1.p1 TRINITY_DN4438_c1_g3~~TRINITY_DN4438_c1_g3_i1.p1  ORF type:complete len:433 (-),score=120.40 TRINITY_DN4438_c1_g3_i1:256-1554(-)
MGDFKPFSAYIVGSARSAGGKKNGALSGYHPADLGAAVVDALVKKTNADPSQVEDVIFGCVSQVGAQAGNVARMVVLASNVLPETVPGVTVDRQCGSSQQALHHAAQAVMSGVHDCVIAGGVEVMSTVPIGANVVDGYKAGHGNPMSDSQLAKYGEKLKVFEQYGMNPKAYSQFGGAELLAKKYGITREDVDSFAVSSHAKAAAAQKAGKFKDEIVGLPVKRAPPPKKKGEKGDEAKAAPAAPASEGTHEKDEGVRPGTTMENVQKLKAMFPTGIISPASSSQICDGAAALMICNERGLKKLGLKPIARIHSQALSATDPVLMLEGPIPATQTCLQKAGLKIEDIDLYEVNEAFASVPLAWAKALGADLSKLNVNGGAMALGHPLGGTGAKLMTTLLHELQRRKGRYGVLSICEGGGTANATVIEMMPTAKL